MIGASEMGILGLSGASGVVRKSSHYVNGFRYEWSCRRRGVLDWVVQPYFARAKPMMFNWLFSLTVSIAMFETQC